MDTSQLDFNLLVTLDTLLAERNVTRAARRLNMSQPALSTRLARLRDMFDDPLLIPVQRGMVPTQKALELQPHLHAALEAVRQVVAVDSAFDPARAKGTIHIAASDYTQSALLLPLVQSLRQEAPGLRIAWHALDLAALHSQMEGGTVDLAILRPQTAPAQLRMRTLCREDYVLIARSGHPDVEGRSTSTSSAASTTSSSRRMAAALPGRRIRFWKPWAGRGASCSPRRAFWSCRGSSRGPT